MTLVRDGDRLCRVTTCHQMGLFSGGAVPMYEVREPGRWRPAEGRDEISRIARIPKPTTRAEAEALALWETLHALHDAGRLGFDAARGVFIPLDGLSREELARIMWPGSARSDDDLDRRLNRLPVAVAWRRGRPIK